MGTLLTALLISFWATGLLAKLPEYPECGKPEIRTAVANGVPAEEAEFPWLAAVLCPKCDSPHCAHKFLCSCPAFGDDQVCKHIHLIVNENVQSDGLPYENDQEQYQEISQVIESGVAVPQEEIPGPVLPQETHEIEMGDAGLEMTQTQAAGGAIPEEVLENTESVIEDAGLEDTLSVVGDDYLSLRGYKDERVIEVVEGADINVKNFEFWRKQTLACVSAISSWQKKISELPRTEEGVKELMEMRNKRIFETKLPTKLPVASRQRKHTPIDRGFPTKLPKLDKTRRKKNEETEPKVTNYKYLVDEALKSDYTAWCWGRIAHFDNYDWLATFLRGYSKDDRDHFYNELKEAREHWKCSECQTLKWEKWNSKSTKKYVGCGTCENWGHRVCSGLQEEATEAEEEAWHAEPPPDLLGQPAVLLELARRRRHLSWTP